MEFLNNLSDWVNATSSDYRPEIAWTVRILLAVLVFFVGYFISRIIASLVGSGINRISFIRSANANAVTNDATIGASIGKALFYLLLLVVAAIALSILGLTQVVAPVENMWNEMLGFVPNLIGAAAFIGFGLIFANIVRKLVESVLEAANVDGFVSPVEGEQANGLSAALAWIVFTLIAIPAVIAGIDVLGVEAISRPTSDMLEQVALAVPKIAVAGVVLVIAYIISRFVSKLLETILPPTGIDTYVHKFGLLEAKSEKGLTATKAISTIVGIAIMLFGAVEATKLLSFDVLSDFVQIVLEQGGQILFGTLIIAFGFIFANIVGKVLDAAGTGVSDDLAKIVKYVIMGLAVILGLSRMGLDPSGGMFILDVAEYLVIAAAVALGVGGAIAFGLGGKEWAGKKLELWFGDKPAPKTTTRSRSTTAKK